MNMHRKILIADDNPVIQKEMQQLLHEQGYEVVTVGDGDLVIETMREFRPHMVMLDIIMPGKTGYEICGFIKSEGEMNQIPVILTYSENEPFNLEEARRCGATRCLPKNIEPDNLIAALNFIWAEYPGLESHESEDQVYEIEVEPIKEGEIIDEDNVVSQFFEVKLRDTQDVPGNGTSTHKAESYSHLFDTSIIKIQNYMTDEERPDDPLHVEEDLLSHHCPECGARVIIGDIFCVECGGALDESLGEPADKLSCEECGQTICHGDVFCLNCGAVQ